MTFPLPFRTAAVRLAGSAVVVAVILPVVLYQTAFPIQLAPDLVLCAAFGIPLAAGLALGWRGVGAVAVGSVLTLYVIGRLADGWVVLLGAVAEAAVAAVYIRQVDLGRGLTRLQDVVRLSFACLAGVAARGIVSAAAGGLAGISHWWEIGLLSTAISWIAVTTLTPLVLAWSIPKFLSRPAWALLVEGLAVFGILSIAVVTLSLRMAQEDDVPSLPIAVLVAVLIWIVYRFEVLGTSLALVLSCVLFDGVLLLTRTSSTSETIPLRGLTALAVLGALNLLMLALAAMARERRLEAEANVRLLDELLSQRDATHNAATDLSRERGFLAAVLDQLPNGIVIFDPAGKVVLKNQAQEQYFGSLMQTGSSITDLRDHSVRRPDGSPLPFDERPSVLTLRDHRAHLEPELYHTRSDGSEATISSQAVPILGPGGQFLGVVAVLHDLTDRKQADQKLRLTDQRLRTALRSAGMIAWDWNLTDGSVWRSEPLEIWLDLPHDPSMSRGTTFTPLIHPDDVAAVDDQMAAVTAGREELDSTYRMRRSDGAYVWVNSRGKTIDDDHGRPTGRMAGVLIDITDRKRQEQRLRLLESAVVHARDAVVILEAEASSRPGRSVLYINEAFTRLTGYTAREVVGRSLHFLRGPRSDPAALDRLKDALATGTPLLVELLNYRKDGTELWVEISLVPVPDTSGKLAHWVMIQRDISDRKRAEDELRASQTRLAEAQRIAELGYWEWDLDTGCVVWSDETFRLLGYEPHSVLPDSKRFFDGVHAEDRPRVESVLGLSFAPGASYEFDCRVFRTDGAMRHMHIEGQLSRRADGHPYRLSGIIRDVTTQTEAAEALRRGEERYRLLFDANPHPMWVFDEETLRFLAVNDAALRKYGYTRDEFLGMTISEIRPPVEAPKSNPNLLLEDRLVPSGDPNVRRHRTKTGADLDVEISSYRFQFDGRNAQLILANDVTDRRRLEDQLRQAQKMEAVGQMAGGIAHDFNNLLTGIVGNLALVDLPADDPNRLLLATAERAAHRAADLTRKLLGFARKNQLLVAPVRVREFAQEVVDLLRRTFDPRIEIVTDLAAPATILADATLMNQALLNLCLNARDAMPEGGCLTIAANPVTITEDDVTRNAAARPGAFIRLCVFDTGHGMTPDVQARAYEPFFTTKPVGQGTGLGLAMVHGIVQQHGGWMTLESGLGEGTRFELYLPAADSAARPPGSGTMSRASTLRSALSESTLPPLGSPPRTVLLVDDEDMIRTIARTVLETDGFHVIEAGDGLAAVEVFRTEFARIDLVILDLTMPRLSGRDTFRIMIEIDPGARVLFSSGYSADDLSDVTGAIGLLAKPYRPFDLLLAVRRALHGQPTNGEQTSRPVATE